MSDNVLNRRLVPDPNLLGYWGFDEADETDDAFDESTYLNPLVTVTDSVVVGRIGNARHFNGSSSVASPASSVLFRLSGELTLITWAKIDQYLPSGSLLRCILACDGSTGAAADNTQYALFVDNAGRLVYRHENGLAVQVELKTAPGTFKIGRFYNVVVIRYDVGGGQQTLELYLDNVVTPWATVTVGGTPQSQPVPAPDGGSTSTLKIGQSDKSSDAKWFGSVDESSIHDTPRSWQPYLRSLFFGQTILQPVARLSNSGTLRGISAVDMVGTRWWTYERDGSLFVVREETSGFFSNEVQLLSSGGIQPAGASNPSLVYDAASDTLLIIFLAAGKVYKITASFTDLPSTQLMPYTVDQPGILKAEDSLDSPKLGSGESSIKVTDTPYFYTNRLPLKVLVNESGSLGAGETPRFIEESLSEILPVAPSGLNGISFVQIPTFGIFVPFNGAAEAYGYEIYRFVSGLEVDLGSVLTTYVGSPFNPGAAYFFPISSRIFGGVYYVKPLNNNLRPGKNVSNIIIDFLGMAVSYNQLLPNILTQGKDGDGGDLSPVSLGSGDTISYYRDTLSYINRTPIKIGGLSDLPPLGTGESGLGGLVIIRGTGSAHREGVNSDPLGRTIL